MKKFYTLIVVALSALCASAALPELQTVFDQNAPSMLPTHINAKPGHAIKAAAAPSLNNFVAEKWDFWWYHRVQGSTGWEKKPLTITKSGMSGIKIVGLFSDFPVVASYSTKKGITIASQKLFDHAQGEVYLCFSTDDDLGVWSGDIPEVTATWNETEGIFLFPEEVNFWIGIKNLGIFDIGYYCSIEPYVAWEEPDPDMESTWTYVGDAQFVDGWTLPYLLSIMNNNEEGKNYGDQFNYPWSVPVERADDLEGVFRLVNPYHQPDSPIASDTEEGGYIIFNIDNPEFPFFYPEVYSGMTWLAAEDDEEDEDMRFYCYDLFGLYHCIGGYTEDDMVEELEGNLSILSTFKNDILTVPSPRFGFSESTRNDGYYWTLDSDLTAVIDLSNVTLGVQPVSVDNNSNAPVEFFNLQGIRVDNPRGGVFIRRQGAQTMKVVRK